MVLLQKHRRVTVVGRALLIISLGSIALSAVACGRADDESADDGDDGDDGDDAVEADAVDRDRNSADECDDITGQILAALQENVSAGVLLATAIPCGDEGIANRPDYFDSRVRPEDVEYLQGAFADACEKAEAACSQTGEGEASR